jgi:acetolactate synthase-1/2/3 large subunit
VGGIMKFDEALVKYLEDMGVKYVFGVPGDIQTDFSEALRKSNIRFITTKNEKSAVFMADIYSRVSGKVGVCFSTVGPGATNLVSGLANATGDKSSVIAISDQLTEEFLESHQYVDQGKLFHPSTGVTKASFRLTPENLKKTLEAAYTEAMSEPKGAVHVCMPVSVHKKEVSYSVLVPKVKKLKEISNPEKLSELITGKKNMVILGGVVSRTGVNEEVMDWIERCDIPTLSTFRGKDAIPNSHPLFVGTISRYLVDEIAQLFKEADNLILVGYDYNEGVKPELWKEFKGKLININTFDNHVKGFFEPELNFFGELKGFFKKVGGKSQNKFNVRELRAQIQRKIYQGLDMDVYPPRPHKIIEAINIYFPDAIKVCDIGKNKYYSGLLLNARKPNTVFFSNMQSAMGFSSGALGATFATDGKVLAVTGDGGFMMEPQEIATAIRYNKRLTVIIFNDCGLGLVRAKQLKDFNMKYEVDFPNPDFIKFAESFGAKGYSVKSWGELHRIMKEVAESDQFSIIEVPVDYSEGI